MKKKFLAITLTCFMAMNADAQVYAGDTWLPMPTMDLYDTGMMNMYARALAETAARRQAYFERCSDQAVEAYNHRLWNDVIYYVNEALETKYYNGYVYFLRGYAYEQLGNLRAAKKDYRKGKKYNSREAAWALDALKARSRRR